MRRTWPVHPVALAPGQGGVVESNFDDDGLLQQHEMPEIEGVILESDRPT
ncbi:hypothetical protein GIX45_19000 [Erwinia sp. CPCC 100877]|nr:hypothetical protein [Erwinia sp. CPCC 100877]